MSEKKEEVKAFFEQPEIYLNFDYNLRIRTETVLAYTAGMHFEHVLDMPCGNGQISLPLLDRCDRLTQIDFAAKMTAIAQENVPTKDKARVTVLTNDFFKADLAPSSFDLIISLGILAHVDDTEAFLAYAASLLKPGGYLVVQNTDGDHFYSALIRAYLGVRRMVGKDKYRLNRVSGKGVEAALIERGFTKVKEFRYNQSFLGFSRLFSNRKKYDLTRRWFGDLNKQKKQSWGSDRIYLFEKKPA